MAFHKKQEMREMEKEKKACAWYTGYPFLYLPLIRAQKHAIVPGRNYGVGAQSQSTSRRAGGTR